MFTTSPGGFTSRGGSPGRITATRNESDALSPSASVAVQVYSTWFVGSAGVVPVTRKPLRVNHDGSAGDSV